MFECRNCGHPYADHDDPYGFVGANRQSCMVPECGCKQYTGKPRFTGEASGKEISR